MNFKMSLHPITFGVMLVVAAGTLIYHFWNQNQQQHQQYQHHQQGYRSPNRGPEPNDNSSVSSAGSDDKKRSTKRKKKSDLCSICLGELSSELKALTCTHIFHKNCITQWLKLNNTCPICRKISEATI